MWRHAKPRPEEFNTDEEYLSALEFYYRELDNYIDDYIERRREEE